MIAAGIGLVSLILYAWSVARQGTTASPVSWAIWACVPAVVLAGTRTGGTGWWLPAAELAGTIGVLVLSLRYGKGWRPERWEWVLLGAVALTLAGWWLTRLAAVAIVVPSLADVAGTAPTAIRDYADPGRESPLARVSWLGLIAAGGAGLAQAPAGVAQFYPACLMLAGAAVTGAWTGGTLARDMGRHAAPRRYLSRGARVFAVAACVAVAGTAAARILQVAGGIPPADIAQAAVRPSPAPEAPPAVPPARHRTVLPPVGPSPSPAAPATEDGGAPAPSPVPVVSASPHPSPRPSPSPSPSATVSPSPSPDPTPSPSPSLVIPSPTASPTPAPSPTPTVTATPSPTYT